MKPVNIYLLSQVKEEQLFSRYENMLSGRKEEKREKKQVVLLVFLFFAPLWRSESLLYIYRCNDTFGFSLSLLRKLEETERM